MARVVSSSRRGCNMSLKSLSLHMWRKLGIAKIPGMRQLRKLIIPNTRSWDDVDRKLQGIATVPSSQTVTPVKPAPVKVIPTAPVTPKPAASSVKSVSPKSAQAPWENRIISKVDYWSKNFIHIKELGLAKTAAHNSLLIENKDKPTAQEENIYKRIMSDNDFLTFRHKNFGIIELSRTETLLSSVNSTDEIGRLVERFIAKSKRQLLNYGFIISVNPRNTFPVAMQQSSFMPKLICIFTPDFDGNVDQRCLEAADRVICPALFESKIESINISSLAIYEKEEQLFETLISSIRDLLPKEYNALLPAWNAFDRVVGIENYAITKRDLILKLNCSEKNAPNVKGTFDEYITQLSKVCVSVLASEELCQNYANLIAGLDDQKVRKTFLLRAFNDGARCEMIYG